MTRSILTLLSVFCALTLLPTYAKAEEFSAGQKEELNKLFEDYLMNNGDKILKSVNTYQAKLEETDRKEASEKAAAFLKEIKDKKDLPMAGNPDGDITVVEFFDYNCGYCSKALEEVKTILKDDKNVKVILFDMPILGPESLEASKWALAAHKQVKYFEFHVATLEHKGPKTPEELEKIAKNLGLDIKKMKKDKDSEEVSKTLQAHVEQAQLIGIRGTPGFIIGDQLSPGYIPAAQMEEQIKAARAK